VILTFSYPYEVGGPEYFHRLLKIMSTY